MHEMNMDTQFVYVIITMNLKYCLQLKNYLHVQLTKSTRNKSKDNHASEGFISIKIILIEAKL